MPVGQSGIAALGANSIITGLLGGGIGAMIGVVAAEVLKSPDDMAFRSDAQVRFDSGVWVGIIGLVLGATLASWSALTSQAWERAVRDALIGGIVGAVAGFVGGYSAQWIFSTMLESLADDYWDPPTQSEIENRILLARAVGWGLFGTVLGGGLGLPGGARKTVNGVIGGAIGGMLGGVAFELLGRQAEMGDSGFMFRAIGMVLTGIGIGLAIGLVDRITRQAWIQFSSGPLRGREVILFKPRTSIGGSAMCDVVLANDPTTSPLHATIVQSPSGLAVEPAGPVEVDGVSVTGHHPLRPGQVVRIGRSDLTVGSRAVR